MPEELHNGDDAHAGVEQLGGVGMVVMPISALAAFIRRPWVDPLVPARSQPARASTVAIGIYGP